MVSENPHFCCPTGKKYNWEKLAKGVLGIVRGGVVSDRPLWSRHGTIGDGEQPTLLESWGVG